MESCAGPSLLRRLGHGQGLEMERWGHLRHANQSTSQGWGHLRYYWIHFQGAPSHQGSEVGPGAASASGEAETLMGVALQWARPPRTRSRQPPRRSRRAAGWLESEVWHAFGLLVQTAGLLHSAEAGSARGGPGK
jgi:hypothetical protein